MSRRIILMQQSGEVLCKIFIAILFTKTIATSFEFVPAPTRCNQQSLYTKQAKLLDSIVHSHLISWASLSLPLFDNLTQTFSLSYTGLQGVEQESHKQVSKPVWNDCCLLVSHFKSIVSTSQGAGHRTQCCLLTRMLQGVL